MMDEKIQFYGLVLPYDDSLNHNLYVINFYDSFKDYRSDSGRTYICSLGMEGNVLYLLYLTETDEKDTNWEVVTIRNHHNPFPECITATHKNLILESAWGSYLYQLLDKDKNLLNDWFIFPSGTNESIIIDYFRTRYDKEKVEEFSHRKNGFLK